jgi:ABC-type transporter Mla subunit MlaD
MSSEVQRLERELAAERAKVDRLSRHNSYTGNELNRRAQAAENALRRMAAERDRLQVERDAYFMGLAQINYLKGTPNDSLVTVHEIVADALANAETNTSCRKGAAATTTEPLEGARDTPTGASNEDSNAGH